MTFERVAGLAGDGLCSLVSAAIIDHHHLYGCDGMLLLLRVSEGGR